ncbi:AI-2E family transporter [Nocardia macrotermitis]|uniref:AI-2E family transporter n=1 Tax=Nocardia macrotermitis TaxID=2585198 RepID=UPI0038736BEE
MAADSVHPFVRVSAEWCWRLLVLVLTVVVIGYLSRRLATVVIPVAIALLAAALLVPLVDLLQRLGIPRSIGVFVSLVGSIGVIAGLFTFVIEQIVTGVPQLANEFKTSVQSIQDWLINGPLHLSNDEIRNAGDTIVKMLERNQESLTSGALTTAAAIGEFLTGTFLTLFILIFFLYGGNQIWEFVTRVVPTPQRERVRAAGRLGFGTLVGFVRATVAVAAVDAIGIGTGLAILGVPLALPLGTLVFIGAFIPIIGSLLAGSIAVFLALMTKGLVTALIVLGITIAVMQLESHVLQPLLLGRAVRIHPLAVVLAITTGVVLYGLVGGLLAVPFAAVMNTAIHSLLSDSSEELYQELNSGTRRQPMFHARPDDDPDPDRYKLADPDAGQADSDSTDSDPADLDAAGRDAEKPDAR